MIPLANKRFWASTRGRIVTLLRDQSCTVAELAEVLGLSGNAVRTHLTALERDGLVRPSGKRPGTRKPIVAYGLTAEAEHLFQKLYGPVLRHFLAALKERVTSRKLEEIARAVAHRMAAEYRPAVQSGRTADRVQQAISVLQELGGLCKSSDQDGKITLRCSDCPLAVVAAEHPEVCLLMETLLSDVLGVPVRKQCRVKPSPECRFEIQAAE